LCSAREDWSFRNSLSMIHCHIFVAGTFEYERVIIVADGLSTTARSGVESLVGLHSRSCPDPNHAKQVLAVVEWLFGFRKQHAAQAQHRLHHQGSKADVEVGRRSLRAADGCD
jgi:hypothetical protein